MDTSEKKPWHQQPTIVLLVVVVFIIACGIIIYMVGWDYSSNYALNPSPKSNPEKYVEDYLEEKGYEVLWVAQLGGVNDKPTDDAIVRMKSLGNREEQVWAGLSTLTEAYPDSRGYIVEILTPTQTCHYSTFLTDYDLYKKMVRNRTLVMEHNVDFEKIIIPLDSPEYLDYFSRNLEWYNEHYGTNFTLTDSGIDGLTLSQLVDLEIKREIDRPTSCE